MPPYCYDLDPKCLPKAYALKALFQDDCVLGHGGPLEEVGLRGRKLGHWGCSFKKKILKKCYV